VGVVYAIALLQFAAFVVWAFWVQVRSTAAFSSFFFSLVVVHSLPRRCSSFTPSLLIFSPHVDFHRPHSLRVQK